MPPVCLRFFSIINSPHTAWKVSAIRRGLLEKTGHDVKITAEYCYYVVLKDGVDADEFQREAVEKLHWLLSTSPFDDSLTFQSRLTGTIKEIGPRPTFKTAYCTNALSVLSAAGIVDVTRLERSIRYQFDGPIPDDETLLQIAGDQMTESIYHDDFNFAPVKGREKFFEIDVLGDPMNLNKANKELGLAFDESDICFYKDVFLHRMKRNPTDVELFDLAQSNSEHSRHWFFRGCLFVDDKERKESLMDSIRGTQRYSNPNNIIAFNDNSSAIRGFDSLLLLLPSDPTTTSPLQLRRVHRHITYSAETHNFPTAICPFQGATTGTGGRIRDTHATGRGSHEIAGVAGYSFGNLHLPDYRMPWEDDDAYPYAFSHPSNVAIEASNGASDYGNKFGEPVVCGFARSFGQRLVNGERCEYVKPIMFSGGIGAIDDDQTTKMISEQGMLLAKIGGPVYRVGVGGGAASSHIVQGSRESVLDFCAVQRGDAEMGQKLHRVVRACAEMGDANPILAIHDQGAGGNGNVLKELVESGGGAVINASSFELGDDTISARELWTAEYQENDACLVDASCLSKMMKISRREKCAVSVVGTVTKEKRIVLTNFIDEMDNRKPVDFDLKMLGTRGRKVFTLRSLRMPLKPLELPARLTVRQALEMVLRLPSVASKRYLTCKVDRSVTGLIARQQCVGPIHTPLADVAVVALSYFDKVGAAVAVGEQPIKGLVSPAAGARMTVAETLTNLLAAPITDIKDVKMSGNWMWAAKCDGEGARLIEACDALCRALADVGCAIDGGKDSLGMATTVDDKLVKAPGTLVLSAYAPCPDVTKVLTPDFKGPQDGGKCTNIMYIRMGSSLSYNRLGGSALAQVLRQIGDDPADVEDLVGFARTFTSIQKMIMDDVILSVHDVSDGGFITALLEMSFAGNISFRADITCESGDPMAFLFAEEAGVFVEVEQRHSAHVIENLKGQFEVKLIGEVYPQYGPHAMIEVIVNGEHVINEKLVALREVWEETSDRLGLMQTDAMCLQEAKQVRALTTTVVYSAPFHWQNDDALTIQRCLTSAPRVAIIREEGSNGDREMAAAFIMAGFEAHDVTMTDLLSGHTLDHFRVVAFVGGFSYADVLGSAKGWAAAIRYNPVVRVEFSRFRNRSDTLSFGVCNGCQLMAYLGWVGEHEGSPSVFLAENRCGRFESIFGPVRIVDSTSIWLKDMAGAILGLWSSHGEGRFVYRSPDVLDSLRNSGQIAVQYVDGDGRPSMMYPWNPNGSEDSVAAICSRDGRHLAMMPHSDRSFLSWQWTDYPREWKTTNCASPWLKMFHNAYTWVVNN